MLCAFMKVAVICVLASAPSADSLLSMVPFLSRSKPSLASAIASAETTIWRSPMKGTTVGPLHSGTGLNGSAFVLHPSANVAPTRRRNGPRMHPSKNLWSAASIASRVVIVNLVTWMCASGTALAHPEFSATLTNRYVKLSLLSANELRLAYTVMYGAAPALAARRAADANRDGKLDDAETRALGARLAEEASRGIELTVDGARVTLKFEEPQVGLAGAEVQANPFSIDLIARVPAPGAGAHEVRFDDRTALPELGETEVRIEESPTAQLLAAHRGPTG